MKLYQAIVNNAILTKDFQSQKDARAKRIKDLLPSGSGFDLGSKLLTVTENKIIIETAFHHMDGNGFYDGWTEHKITIKPDFISGINITVSGKNKNMIKDYIHEIFDQILMSDFDWIHDAQD